MLRILVSLAGLSGVLFFSPAHAGFYKCLDADGNVTYSQTACPEDQKTDKIISAGGRSSSNDCRITGFFASKVAKQMRRGASSGTVFDQYGGMDYIPRTSLALINYIYTFEENYNTTPERIAALTTARCRSGSFGPTSCSDFPPSYIQNAGGCENAEKGLSGYAQPQQLPRNGQENGQVDRPQPGQGSFQQNLGAARAAAARGDFDENSQSGKEKCISRQQDMLANINAQMRQQLSAAAQDSLRLQKRAARKNLSQC